MLADSASHQLMNDQILVVDCSMEKAISEAEPKAINMADGSLEKIEYLEYSYICARVVIECLLIMLLIFLYFILVYYKK